jgi:hypothetical protein
VSDERFDDAIRDALLTDDPGAVPRRLQARMAMIPDQQAKEQGVRGWQRRVGAFVMPAAALAAVVVVAILVGGTWLHDQQAASAVPTMPSPGTSFGPSAVPSPVSTGEPSESANASSTPSAAAAHEPAGPISLTSSDATGLTANTFGIHNGISYYRGFADATQWPTLYYQSLSDSQSGGALVMLKNGHEIDSWQLSDAGLVWVERWYEQPAINCGSRTPCNPHGGQALSWALNLTTFDGTTTKLDGGLVSRISVAGPAASPLAPAMGTQGSRVAYAVPRLGAAGAPEASTIIVRSLPDGNILRTIDTTGYVQQLGVLGQAIAYREGFDVGGKAGTVDAGGGTLNVVTSDGASPSAVATGVADFMIGDGGQPGNDRVAWTLEDATDVMIRVASLADLGTVHAIVPEGLPGGGTMRGASSPTIVGDGVAWSISVLDTTGAGTSDLQVWHPGWRMGHVVRLFNGPLGAAGDQLIAAGPVPQRGDVPTSLVPAAALFGGQ